MVNYVCMYVWPEVWTDDFLLISQLTIYYIMTTALILLRDFFYNFKQLFHGNFIYARSFCQKSVEGQSPKVHIFIIRCASVWPGFWNVTILLINQHTFYGDDNSPRRSEQNDNKVRIFSNSDSFLEKRLWSDVVIRNPSLICWLIIYLLITNQLQIIF